ncbi:MAG: TetR/AcrR family transcriptional regulator [Myxococcota bacterium]
MADLSTEERAKKRRDELTDAALRVLVSRGMGGFSSRAIAREAGVNPAMIHYSFDSMEQLVGAVVDKCVRETQQVLSRARVEQMTLPCALECLAFAYWRYVVENPERLRVQYELTMHALTSGNSALAQAQYDGYVDVTANKLACTCALSPQSLRIIAGACVGMVDGLTLQLLTTNDHDRCERSLLLSVRFFQELLRDNEPVSDDYISSLTNLNTWTREAL